MYTVRGRVTEHGHPVVGASVSVSVQRLRTDALIGTSVTDADGRYEISGTDKATRAPATGVVVRVLPKGSKKDPIEIRAQGADGEDVVVDVDIDDGSEWSRILGAVAPLLAAQGDKGRDLAPWHLVDSDISVLAEHTGLPGDQLRLWVEAVTAVHERWPQASVGDSPEFMAVYAWRREGLPSSIDDILLLPADGLMTSLDKAAEQHVIPPLGRRLQKALRGAVAAARAEVAMRPAGPREAATRADALRMLPGAKALELDSERGRGPRLLARLLEQPDVSMSDVIRSEIDDVDRADSVERQLRLWTLTGGSAPLIAALMSRSTDPTLTDLVDLDEHEWVSLAGKSLHGADEPSDSDVRSMGRRLMRDVERMHPTAFVARRIATDQIPVPENTKEPLLTFLAANAALRLREDSIVEFLARPDLDAGGLDGDQIRDVGEQLLKVERVARLTPSLADVGPLISNGFASARDVAHRHSREAFVDEASAFIADPADAGAIHDAASGVIATVEALVLSQSPRFAGSAMPVLPPSNATGMAVYGAFAAKAAGQPIQAASLQQLFGNQDGCTCSHGASLYGPAAYLADLLQLLRTGPKHNGRSALDVLLERRPDLAEVDLTGDNADLTIPYLDLVLEVLEAPDFEAGLGFRVVRGGTRQSPVDYGFDHALDQGEVPQALADDLAAWRLPLGEQRTAVRAADVQNSAGATFPSWLIRDAESGLKVRLLGIVPAAYRLRAYPQSVSGAPRAYRPWPNSLSSTAHQVGTARFPWSLPVDLSRDESNAWLAQLGAEREAVMLAFAGARRWIDVDAACEALDLCRAARDILVTAPVAGTEHVDWGFPHASVGAEGVTDPIAGATGSFNSVTGQVDWTSADGARSDPPQWHALLKNVSLLRSRAQVDHRELLAVLETIFVRGGGPRLQVTGDECNPGLMRLEALDASVARRLHLFVRLWRALGWRASDVDRAIAARSAHLSGTGSSVALTSSFLLFAAGIARLHRRSGVAIAELVDFFAGPSLDTTRRWDHSGEQPVLALSRYEDWFDNGTLGRPRRPEFRLDASGAGLQAPSLPPTGVPLTRITDHLTYVAAALGLSERDLTNLLPKSVITIPPMQVTAAGRQGATVDVTDTSAREVEILLGAMSPGAAFELLVEDSQDGHTFAPVDSTLIGGLNPIVLGSTSRRLRRFTYTGSGRFVRATVRATAGTSPTVWLTTRLLSSHGAVEDELSLANLTTLSRWSVLRRVVDRPVADVQTLTRLSGADPLAADVVPSDILALLDDRDRLAAIGLSIRESDELLCGPAGASGAILEEQAQLLLSETRSASHAITEESSVAPAQSSVLLTKVLTDLGWDTQLIARVLGPEVLGRQPSDYTTSLDAVPTGVTLPASFAFDEDAQVLVVASSERPGVLRTTIAPLVATASGSWRQALVALEAQATEREEALARAQALLRAVVLPTHRVSSGSRAVAAFDVPPEWRGRFYYDRGAGEFCFVGWMTPDDNAALKSAVGSQTGLVDFADLMDDLLAVSSTYQPDPVNALVVREGATNGLAVEALLLDAEGSQDRCALLLDRLLPAWRRERLQARVSTALASALGSDSDTALALLRLPSRDSQTGVRESLLEQVTRPELLRSDPAAAASRAAFPGAFDAAVRLLLLGRLVRTLRLSAAEVPWLCGTWTGLDLTTIPTRRVLSPPTGAWDSLVALCLLLAARSALGGGRDSVHGVLAATTDSQVDEERLGLALDCDRTVLRALLSPDGLGSVDSAWLRVPHNLTQLIGCVGLGRRLGLPTELLVRMRRVQVAGRNSVEAETEAQALRQVALAGGLQDAESEVLDRVRLRRRDATVSYLVQARGLRDATDLYGYALIDPEMGPCMLTSRIVQAVSAVQLFVQRCFLGLEPDAPPTSVPRDHWEWMKNYRVWEANRKVLFYPENWIDPELRDDKTPFFDEVVSTLQQGDATSDKAQQAMGTFLERLTDFSRMEIVGTCSAYDDQNQLVTTHVFARSQAEPHAYFHREFRKLDPADVGSALGSWTPWRAISVDIEGDHLIPVVWQGRLFLFWAVLDTEAEEPTAAQLAPNQAGSMPTKFWRLKIAWTERKSGAWTSRHLAQDDLSNIRLAAAAPTPNRRAAAERKDYFYFYTSVREDGVTINGQYLNRYDQVYEPFATLYFDGHRVVRAQGTYQRVTGSATYRFVQRPSEVGEAPVDGRAPDAEIIAHAPAGVFSGAGTPLALNPRTPDSLTFFSSIPRAAKVLFSPETPALPFAAPSPSAPRPIPTSARTTPFFVSDRIHEFMVYPTVQVRSGAETRGLQFYALDWPPAQSLRKALARQGIDGLMASDTSPPAPVPFFAEYGPVPSVITGWPDGSMEFSAFQASGTYNYELFFHAPFAIACALSKNQRFEEARRWLHYIFDPTDSSSGASPARHWQFPPFRQSPGLSIDELVHRLADPHDHSVEKLQFKADIAAWKDQPFKPHLVARMRPRSYMYAVVMKYLDNILDWADQLFRRDTMESINEATQLYVLASQILGRRPESIPPRTRPVVKAFTELVAADPDDLSNALVEAESLIPPNQPAGSGRPPQLWSLYFCLPGNPRLDDYYDRVEDRLFKLRNCMDIEGVERTLSLFSAPIDPGLLVTAAAAGVSISSVLADSQAPLPLYRFSVMSQKASELCDEVRSLGSALLSALETGDAEELALMKSRHERDLLQGIRQVKETQLLEAKATLDALGFGLQSAQSRFSHYVGLVSELGSLDIPTGPVVGPTIERLAGAALDVTRSATDLASATTGMVDPITAATLAVTRDLLSRAAQALSASLPAETMQSSQVPLNAAEQRQLAELRSAHDLQRKAADQRLVAQALAVIPDFTFGAQGWASSPVVQFQLGGSLLSKVASLAAEGTDSMANEHTYRATMHGQLAGFQRRAADWLLQAQMASWEIAQLADQMKAQTLRVAMASHELANHDREAAQALELQEFMSSKFTNRELTNWMSGQLARLHFQAYQLAYDVARRAERCFNNELGTETSFIDFGYWDSLRRGLLAGESLMSDIKRMEVAYLNQNAREFEITKHVSLRELDPAALVRLRDTGACHFTIPEVLFDLDFPGHYFRRLKSVRVSIPCVVGPYTGVSATLTLLSSRLRSRSNAFEGSYGHEENFRASSFPAQAIAISTGQEDSGMFELNFRDDRYLPFEGAGAISDWRIELPDPMRPFDYSTISDVILHVQYTSRLGGGTLKTLANESLLDAFNEFVTSTGDQGFAQLVSLRHDFPNEWVRLMNTPTSGDAVTSITVTKNRFPLLAAHRSITVGKVDLITVPSQAGTPAVIEGLSVGLPDAAASVAMTPAASVGRLLARSFAANVAVSAEPDDAIWTLSVAEDAVSDFRSTVSDVVLLCHYTIADPVPS